MTIEATVDEAIAGINRLRKAGSRRPEKVESDSVMKRIEVRMSRAREIENRRIDNEFNNAEVVK
jgi:hypothetical protein